MFELQNRDVIIRIIELLSDKDKRNLFLCSRIANTFAVFAYFYDLYWHDNNIHKSKYYDQITNIAVTCSVIFPKSVKKIHYHFNKIAIDEIPQGTTHVFFYDDFNQNIKGLIPDSVTHLFFNSFDQDIKGVIPNSITHLGLSDYFRHSVKNSLPDGIIEVALPLLYKKIKLNPKIKVRFYQRNIDGPLFIL